MTTPEPSTATAEIPRPIMCQCEHVDHFDPSRTVHGYMDAVAGDAVATYVGRVCDDCATGHLAEYIVEGS